MDSQPGKASEPGSPASTEPPAPGESRREREHFFRAAKLMAGLTVLSRVLGLLRDMAITSLGANRITSAFILAWGIPNLFRRLFGEGALAGAFVPVFTETHEKQGPAAAGKLFANTLGLLASFLILLTIVIQLGLLAWRHCQPELRVVKMESLPASTESRPADPANLIAKLFEEHMTNAVPAASIDISAPGRTSLALTTGRKALAAADDEPVSVCTTDSGYVILGQKQAVYLDPNFRLLLLLAVIMLPFMVTICLLALGGSALNCRGRFAYPAYAPMILNVFMIVTAWWLAPRISSDSTVQLIILSISVVLAGIVQLIALLALLKGIGLPIRPRLFPAEPGIRHILQLMLPTALGLGFPQLSQLLERVIIWKFSEPGMPLTAGAQVHVYAASQMYQFPMGVLAISLGVAVFPLLSRYAARGDTPNFRQAVNRAIRISLMEGLAAGTGLFVLAGPIIDLIYHRGKFTPADVSVSTDILAIYVLGMWAYCTYQIFLKAFYSLKETKSPLKIVAVMAMLDLGLALGLIWVPGMGARAFAVATVISMSFNVICLAAMLRKRVGLLGGRMIVLSVVRSLAAAGFMAAVVLTLRYWLLAGQANWKVVAVCVPAGAAAFLAAAAVLRMPELRELLGKER